MDIVTLPIEFDKEKIDSKYRVVVIAAQRAKELAVGATPKVQTKAVKYTTIALQETVENKLEYLIGEEARIAKESASKIDYRKLLEDSRKATAGERLSELERDLKVYLNEREVADRKAFDELFSERKQENSQE